MKLGHVHIKVDDLDRAVEFYRTVLELTVRERAGRYVFMSGGSAHHDIALQAVRGRPESSPDRPGLYHVAFEVEDRSELEDAYRRARTFGCHPEAVDHGISESFYLADPADNGVEVYRDTRDETGRTQWQRTTESLNLEGGTDHD